ncbi:hypothetical protein [Haloactinomyces albus]|uniref:Uncharacterized protein n=1 Tax=Haloactinomyces albus TaxID=1352928 RepID=A0AAE3ZFJ9_9ACTN|nr:hypothetical protein [Haloactinomyces albus]MDR7302825.1 hypothetical protein [Haloactinomyces albus]
MHPTPPTAVAAPSSPPGGTGTPQSHDEITRHLTAAVHLKPDFADRVIDTYFSAPSEALPPALGLDARVILTQALVARRRRRARDATVLALMLVAALVVLPYSVAFTLFWGAMCLFWSLTVGLRRTPRREDPDTRDEESGVSFVGMAATVLFLVWLLGGGLFFLFSTMLIASALGSGGSPGVAWFLLALVFLPAVAAIYLVLLADKRVVQQLLATHSSPAPPPQPSPLIANLINRLISAVVSRHGPLLDEVAHRSASGNILVHSGWDAFVAHGHRVSAWTLPLVLRRREQNSDEATPLRPQELYEAVSTELCNMREADLLAPGGRLRDLTVEPLVVASSQGLRRHRDSPLAHELLPDHSGRPAIALRNETLLSLMDQDQEWVRHFQRSSVPSWDSDLVVSTFLNIGCDNRTLYLEWNAYCLFPIAPEYRRGGHVDPSASHAVSLATLEFLQLLGSIARRWRTIRQMAHGLRAAPTRLGATDPTYARRNIESIREMAADDQCGGEFQDLDGQRHIRLLEKRMFSAVRNHLTERGYSTEELDRQSTHIINNTTTIRGGQFVGAHSWGSHSTASTGTVAAAPAPSPAATESREHT